MQLGCVPEIGEVNEVCKTPPVKTTDLYPKLCEENNDVFQGIDKLKLIVKTGETLHYTGSGGRSDHMVKPGSYSAQVEKKQVNFS